MTLLLTLLAVFRLLDIDLSTYNIHTDNKVADGYGFSTKATISCNDCGRLRMTCLGGIKLEWKWISKCFEKCFWRLASSEVFTCFTLTREYLFRRAFSVLNNFFQSSGTFGLLAFFSKPLWAFTYVNSQLLVNNFIQTDTAFYCKVLVLLY